MSVSAWVRPLYEAIHGTGTLSETLKKVEIYEDLNKGFPFFNEGIF